MHQPLSPRLELSDEDWDDLGRECGGWEWVDGEKEGGGKNEFGGTFSSLFCFGFFFLFVSFLLRLRKKGERWMKYVGVPRRKIQFSVNHYVSFPSFELFQKAEQEL